MAKYLWKVSYSSDGLKGLAKEGGTKRRAAVDRLTEGLGGKVESFYYALGDDDASLRTCPTTSLLSRSASRSIPWEQCRSKRCPCCRPKRWTRRAKSPWTTPRLAADLQQRCRNHLS
jgi:hypothetical protein